MEISTTASAGLPRWLNLVCRLLLEKKKVNSAISYAARARADALLDQVTEARSAVTKFGGHSAGLTDLTDDAERDGVWTLLYTISVAELTVSDWDGVTEKNVAGPFRPGLLAQLLTSE